VSLAGTVRSNLDPFSEYSDEDLWEVLDHIQLGPFVRSQELQLEHPVHECTFLLQFHCGDSL